MTVFSNPCSDTSLQDNTAAFPAMIEWATATNRAIAPMEFPDALHYLMKDQKMTVEHLEETSLISTRTIIRLSNDPDYGVTREHIVALSIGLTLPPIISMELLRKAGLTMKNTLRHNTSKRESGSLKQNMIYVRRGTSCEIANEEELRAMFNRRMNYLHPLNGEPLQLEEHLKQLKILYEKIEKNHVYYEPGFAEGLATIFDAITKVAIPGKRKVEPNPLYPDESYEQFVSRMIVEKKKKIERVLDLY